MGSLGMPELVIIFMITLLVFGPKRIPELAKNLGKGIKDFKAALSGDSEEQKHSPPPLPEPPKQLT